MNIQEALKNSSQMLKENGISTSRLDAELIFCHVLHLERPQLLVQDQQELSSEQLSNIHILIEKRAKDEPLAYLLGEKYFYKHCFNIKPGVLIPRPETEFIVEMAVHYMDKSKPIRVYDFGCGSGCIGLSILSELPNSYGVGFDISELAVSLSSENAKKVGVESRYLAKKIDLDKSPYKLDEAADLIVANPPYIAQEDSDIEPNVHDYEPHEALYSPNKGLYHIKIWSQWTCENLKVGGFYIFEIGKGQKQEVTEMLKTHCCLKLKEIVKDYSGYDRTVVCQKVGE